MEIRKLQQTGGASLTITLPKRWVRRFNLSGKDSVAMSVQPSGALLLSPANQHGSSIRTTIDMADAPEDVIKREIISHYIAGADEIQLTDTKISPTQRKWVREAANVLIGFETIDESSKSMLIKNVFDVSKFPTPQNIEKMFVTARSMFEDALTAVSEHDEQLARDVIERDEEMDKLQLAIRRQFHILLRNTMSQEELGLGYEDIDYFDEVAGELERIADHGVKIAHLTIEMRKKGLSTSLLPKFKKIVTSITAMLEEASHMVQSFDKTIAHKLLNDHNGIQDMRAFIRGTYIQRSTLPDVVALDSIDRVLSHIMNIAEITINNAAVKMINGQTTKTET